MRAVQLGAYFKFMSGQIAQSFLPIKAGKFEV
jgi:hypothetical protein